MLHRQNVVDNIDPSLIDEQYIDELPVGITLDYLLGRAVGMFNQHIVVSDMEDEIIGDIIEETSKASILLGNIEDMLSNSIHEMYVNYNDGTVYDIDDWIPSCIFLESLSLDYRITYQVLCNDENYTVIASINKHDVRRNVMNINVSNEYFRAEGSTYSEAMCKCLLKYFFDLGV